MFDEWVGLNALIEDTRLRSRSHSCFGSPAPDHPGALFYASQAPVPERVSFDGQCPINALAVVAYAYLQQLLRILNFYFDLLRFCGEIDVMPWRSHA